MNIDKIQESLFAAYDIKNALPFNIKQYEVNPDTGETVLEYINDIIETLEGLEAEHEDYNPC